MSAVADASPICYLVLIGEIDLLPRLFNQLLVPHVVMTELLHEDAPEAVRQWASKLPSWISVHETPSEAAVDMEKLQAGEQAAILLAASSKADLILLDEKAGRRIAAERGLRVTGTLGVLGEAAARGLVELAPAINLLRKTNFRYSPALLKATLDRYGGRPSADLPSARR